MAKIRAVLEAEINDEILIQEGIKYEDILNDFFAYLDSEGDIVATCNWMHVFSNATINEKYITE